MAFAHILCPVDFSPHADAAIDLAARLATATSAKLTLIHVATQPVLALPEGQVVFSAEQLADMTAQLKLALDRSAQRARDAGAKDVASQLVDGTPAEAICRAASELAADVIVMATHGRTGLSHLLIGSVAERVVRTAPCAVLTIRPTATPTLVGG